MTYLDSHGLSTLWTKIKSVCYIKPSGGIPANDLAETYYLASNPSGYTSNTGTITGITMNGSSKGTSGVVDLGTVITSHQDISGKEDNNNKTTYISSSSTDLQYPSAKCVYDSFENVPTKMVANTSAVSILSDKQVRNIFISTSEPTSADGEVGDIWIKYTV